MVNSITQRDKKIILISLKNCLVSDENSNIVFKPEWGNYDMAIGESITSVFCGAADKETFEVIGYKPKTNTFHPEYDAKTMALFNLYQQVRTSRQNRSGYVVLPKIWNELHKEHPEDWLCALEILEILTKDNIMPELAAEIQGFLEDLAADEPDNTKLINDGLRLIKQPV